MLNYKFTINCLIEHNNTLSGYQHLVVKIAIQEIIKNITIKVTDLDLMSHHEVINRSDLPANLKKLRTGDFFNKPLTLNSLPFSLTHIEFGDSFNQPIVKGVLPNS